MMTNDRVLPVIRMFVAGIGLWVASLLGATPASAEVSCQAWNTIGFFEEASVADVSRCLKAGADVNVRSEHGFMPLHFAARHTEFPAVIATLLEAGADHEAASGLYGSTPLHHAAGFSKNPAVFLEVLGAYLRAGADVDVRNENGATPLHWAASHTEFPAVIATLLEAGADLEAATPWDNNTPLYLAAGSIFNNNPAVVQALLNGGASIHARGYNGCTALHSAASGANNAEVLEVLLKAGTDVNVQCYWDGRPTGVTPLHLAAYENPELSVTETLLKAGADLDAREFNGETPLHRTAGIQSSYQENPAIIIALIAAGANLDARNDSGHTPLQGARERKKEGDELPDEILAAFTDQEAVAAYKEKLKQAEDAARKQEIEEQLREVRVSCDKWNTPGFFRNATATDVAFCLKSESPNAKDDQGRTPMHHAALHGEPAVIAALAEAGADPDALDDSGRTPLHLVAVLGDAPEAVSALAAAGASLDAPDGKGRTPLEFAERFGETPAIVAALREARTTSIPAPNEDAAASCENWNTPGFFRKAGPEDLARCLRTRDPNARNENGRTPMHYAAQGTSPAMVTALAKAGANLNSPDERGGWTPLHLAAWFSETPSVVAALLAAGADPAVKDGEGKTPWDYAQSNIALKDTPVYWRLDEERSN